MLTPLQLAVLRVCDEVDRLGGPALAEAAAHARRHLLEPLRVAVVGRVKAGKSTLVNAVLGRRVAATDDVECTRVVTRYEYGPPPERATLHLSGGRPPVEIPLRPDGTLPDELGHPVDEISHVVVRLCWDTLRDLTLVDTPGLSTTTAENEAAARAHVLGVSGVRQADALVYVFRGEQYRDDVEFLREYAAGAGASAGAAAAIGVLSGADAYGPGAWGDADPLRLAERRAGELARERADELAAVLPLAGRLAESALTGSVTEADARALASFRELSEAELMMGMAPPEVSAERAARLDLLLGPYGIRHGREAAAAGATELAGWMIRVSGVRALQDVLRAHYVGRHPVLKAKVAMEQLERAARAAPDPMPLARLLSDARRHPDFQPLEELRAWERIVARRSGHPLVGRLDALLSGRDDAERVGLPAGAPPEEVRRLALQHAGEAQRFALAGDATVQFAAETVTASLALLLGRSAR